MHRLWSKAVTYRIGAVLITMGCSCLFWGELLHAAEFTIILMSAKTVWYIIHERHYKKKGR